MDTFNIIAGVVSIASFFISLFVATKVVKIANKINLTVDNSKNVKQRVSGEKNSVSAGDINNV